MPRSKARRARSAMRPVRKRVRVRGGGADSMRTPLPPACGRLDVGQHARNVLFWYARHDSFPTILHELGENFPHLPGHARPAEPFRILEPFAYRLVPRGWVGEQRMRGIRDLLYPPWIRERRPSGERREDLGQ